MNPAIDVNMSVDNFVAERKLRCGNPSREPGGGGINVSRAIRKLGGESVALYSWGGLTGRMFQESFFGVVAGTAAVMTPGTKLCHCEDAAALYGCGVIELLCLAYVSLQYVGEEGMRNCRFASELF